jgi:hypothetical protein
MVSYMELGVGRAPKGCRDSGEAMGRAQTVRTGKLGKMELRLVEQDGTFYGMAQ